MWEVFRCNANSFKKGSPIPCGGENAIQQELGTAGDSQGQLTGTRLGYLQESLQQCMGTVQGPFGKKR
jgi:hypothetical protein